MPPQHFLFFFACLLPGLRKRQEPPTPDEALAMLEAIGWQARCPRNVGIHSNPIHSV